MLEPDGTIQTVTTEAPAKLSTRLAAAWRQMRETRQTLTLRGWGFAAKYERIETTNELSDGPNHQRCSDTKK